MPAIRPTVATAAPSATEIATAGIAATGITATVTGIRDIAEKEYETSVHLACVGTIRINKRYYKLYITMHATNVAMVINIKLTATNTTDGT